MANPICLKKQSWQGTAFALWYYLQNVEKININDDVDLVFLTDNLSCFQEVQKVKRVEGKNEISIYLPSVLGVVSSLPMIDQQLIYNMDPLLKQANRAFFKIFQLALMQVAYDSWLSQQLLLSFKNNQLKLEKNVPKTLVYLTGSNIENDIVSHFLAPYALLLQKKYISLSTLQSLLIKFFKFPLKVNNLIIKNEAVEIGNRLTLQRNSHKPLGYDSILGQSIPIYHNQIRIIFGPLDMETYKKFMPGGHYLKLLTQILKALLPAHIITQCLLVLNKKHAPRLQLASQKQGLGHATWLITNNIIEHKKGCAFSIN